MEAQDDTKEILLAEEERLKEKENEVVRLSCDSGAINARKKGNDHGHARQVISLPSRADRLDQPPSRQFLRANLKPEPETRSQRLWSSTLGL